MIGGKIIGQGTYGCVFNPPLLCRRKQISSKNVGKITTDEDYAREVHIYKIINKINESNKYFVISKDNCIIKDMESQVEPDVNKCRFLKKESVDLDGMHQIIMPYGGIALHSISRDKLPFFSFMKHILEAGTILLAHGIVHYDLHSNNILIDKQNNARIIDFGQSFTRDEISLNSINERIKELSPEFSTEPPEVTFLTAISEYNRLSFEETMVEVMPKKRILHKIEKILGIPFKTQLRNLNNFFKTSKAYHDRDLVKIWNLYYPGFDSWAIGVLLLEDINKLLFSYEFIESSEWKLKKGIIINILKKMLHTNPKERIDCIEALSIFDPVNDIFMKYGTEWVETRQKQRRIKGV
jgi:serine/threonine protein kinase